MEQQINNDTYYEYAAQLKQAQSFYDNATKSNNRALEEYAWIKLQEAIDSYETCIKKDN